MLIITQTEKAKFSNAMHIMQYLNNTSDCSSSEYETRV